VTDLAFTDPCVLFALRREARPFYREFRPHQRFRGARCRARFCGPPWLTVLALEMGVGAAHARQAAEWVLGSPVLGNLPYRPRIVLSAGFSGALSEDYRVGDILLASEVVDTEGSSWPTTWPESLPAGAWRPLLHRGRLLTATAVVSSPEEKRALGEKHQAVAVDMESAYLARLCKERGVPFGCIRSISDDWQTPLSPRLARLLAGGRVAPVRVVMALAASPRLAGEMWRLARATRVAADQLGKALGELLTLTLPWGGDL